MKDEKNSDEKLSHDTVGMVVIDNDRHIAGGTSTNGMTWKIPGYVISIHIVSHTVGYTGEREGEGFKYIYLKMFFLDVGQ